MTTIPVKIDDAELMKIDYLVKIGRFKNRNQAILSFIREKLVNETQFPNQEDRDEEKQYREILAKLRNMISLPVQIESTNTTEELVDSERDRI